MQGRPGVLFAIFFVAVAAIALHAFVHAAAEPGVFTFGEYYHLRLGSYAPWPAPDDALERGSALAYTPYHALLYASSRVLPEETAVYLIGAMLAGFASLFFALILMRVGVHTDRVIVACAIVIVSPAFTTLFSRAQPGGLALAIVLLGAYLLLARGSAFFVVGGIACFLFSLFFGPAQSLAAVALCALAVVIERSRRMVAGWMFVAGAAAFLYASGFFSAWRLAPSSVPFGLIAELGYEEGIGLFVFLGAAIGGYTLWKRRGELWPAYVLVGVFGCAAFVVSSVMVVYLLLVLALFSSAGVFRLIEAKWEVDVLKHLTLVLVVCGLLFTFLVSASADLSAYPPVEVRQAAGFFVREQTQGAVLTLPEYGGFLQYAAGVEVYATPRDGKDARNLLMMRNPAQVEQEFVSRGISYVLIDDRMRDGAVWSRPEEGLLFALRDNELFEREYLRDGVEIWRLTP